MNLKALSTILTLFLMLAIVVPIVSVTGQAVPNPNHVYTTSIGMPETIDPGWAYDTASGGLIHNILEPLCIFNVTDVSGFLPALADDWPGLGVGKNEMVPSAPHSPSPAGTVETWYFHIRTGVQWQDPAYGTVLPSDVEYTIERGMLMDHTAGPYWMFYEPLLAGASSYDYDLDGGGVLNFTEWLVLDQAVAGAIESNSTHVWFNLAQSYAPYQQILCQSWSMVMDEDWCIDEGLWNSTIGHYDSGDPNATNVERYDEFIRTWDPTEPGPLMDPAPRIMGSGAFKLAAYDPDPHTGSWTIEAFDNYWRGWPAAGEFYTTGVAAASNITYATYKNVEEWPNRKAQFFSTNPNLQADFCAVPRANCPELHQGGDKDAATLPGFRLRTRYDPLLYAVYYVFDVRADSPYIPKIGTTPNQTMFADRDLRLAFNYMFNFTRFIADAYLGEAVQSPICLPPGTAYFNGSKPMYDIDIAKATSYFQTACDGQIWTDGMTVTMQYNIGNVARQTTAEMFEYNVENLIAWPAGVTVDIQVIGIPWSVYLPGMRNHQYPTFIVGWLADYPDAHNWIQPFMHPSGTYCGRQRVEYGLDFAGLVANWNPGATYPPPPFTNWFSEYVNGYNNTYVRSLIDRGIAQPPAGRTAIYEELYDLYWADATQLPMCYPMVRHYERTWMNGYVDSYNEASLCPDLQYYQMWKAAGTTVFSVDISAQATIANTTHVYPEILVTSEGEMMVGGGDDSPAMMNYSIHVARLDTGAPPTVYVYIGLLRENTTGEYFFPLDYYIPLAPSPGPGDTYTAEIQWYEEDSMQTGVWTVWLYTSPSGTTGAGNEVEDSNLANNEQSHAQTVDARTLFADIREDGYVNILDALRLAAAFGTSEGDEDYNPLADLNGDETINILDAIKLAANFGNHWP